MADAAQEYVESCECQMLCEHGFSPDTRFSIIFINNSTKIESSGRYGEKPWFHLGFSDGQRFGQNLFFSYLSDEKRATEPTKNWHSEIVQVEKKTILILLILYVSIIMANANFWQMN